MRRETSVARSASVPLPPEVCKVEDSVGAGNGGLTPIATVEPAGTLSGGWSDYWSSMDGEMGVSRPWEQA